MPTLESLRRVRPDTVMLDKGVKLHLSFETVNKQWRDLMDTPRTFCGQRIEWWVSKRPNWNGEPVVDGIAVCNGCFDTWQRTYPGRLPGR